MAGGETAFGAPPSVDLAPGLSGPYDGHCSAPWGVFRRSRVPGFSSRAGGFEGKAVSCPPQPRTSCQDTGKRGPPWHVRCGMQKCPRQQLMSFTRRRRRGRDSVPLMPPRARGVQTPPPEAQGASTSLDTPLPAAADPQRRAGATAGMWQSGLLCFPQAVSISRGELVVSASRGEGGR